MCCDMAGTWLFKVSSKHTYFPRPFEISGSYSTQSIRFCIGDLRPDVPLFIAITTPARHRHGRVRRCCVSFGAWFPYSVGISIQFIFASKLCIVVDEIHATCIMRPEVRWPALSNTHGRGKQDAKKKSCHIIPAYRLYLIQGV